MSNYGSWGSWGNDEEWDSEHDSTWEDDEDHKLLKQAKPKQRNWQYSRGRGAAKDLHRYRHSYPISPSSKVHKRTLPMLNLQFYQNEIPFIPNGVFIDDFHQNWKFDYYELESNHNFIQWLFPLQEPGVNRSAEPLTIQEIEKMKRDDGVMKRLMESYRLMLGFYGIQLVDSETGEVARAGNWRERFSNLNSHTNNNLRITRILKCLGEFGYEHYQVPLVRFFLEETLCHGNLQKVKESALNYFMFTVKNKSERKELVLFAWENYEPKDQFIWGPVRTLRKLRPPAPSPVEKSDDGSKDVQAQDEILSVQNNRSSKDDRECVLENHGRITSSPANGKKNKERKRTEKTESDSHLPAHDSVEKESTSQRTENTNEYKENEESPIVLVLRNGRDNEDSPVVSVSRGNKDIEKELTESESRKVSENGELEDDKKKGESSSEEDKDKRELPTKFRPEEGKDNREQSAQTGAANEQPNKKPSPECDSGDNTKKEVPPMELQSEDENNGGPLTCFELKDDKGNGKQPMQPGVADENDKRGQQRDCELVKHKEKGGPPKKSGSEEDMLKVEHLKNGREKREPQIESRSEIDRENGDPPTQPWQEDDLENGDKPVQPRPEDDWENENQPTQPWPEDDSEDGDQPTQPWPEDDGENGDQLMYSKPEVGKDESGQQAECESENRTVEQ